MNYTCVFDGLSLKCILVIRLFRTVSSKSNSEYSEHSVAIILCGGMRAWQLFSRYTNHKKIVTVSQIFFKSSRSKYLIVKKLIVCVRVVNTPLLFFIIFMIFLYIAYDFKQIYILFVFSQIFYNMYITSQV